MLWVSTGLILVAVSFSEVCGQDFNPAETINEAREAGIEVSMLNELSNRAEQNNLPDQTLVTILRSATELARNGLPYKQVFNKSYEGFAKGISPDRIESNVLTIQERTIRAADMIDSWLAENRDLPVQTASHTEFRNELTVAISKVNENSASASAAKTILHSLSNRSLPPNVGLPELATAISTLSQMTSVTPPWQADKIVIRALRSGLSVEKLQQLPSLIHHPLIQNGLPSEARITTIPGHLSGDFPFQSFPWNMNRGFPQPNPPKGTPL
ncbi:hypothetical protein NC796_08345 [Aliifodinibius sp. S!AR15-10]|nr:hypothetical protein [Aliifodinibius sp. S!AR15-10]